MDVDCHWKWLELALFGGVKRERSSRLSANAPPLKKSARFSVKRNREPYPGRLSTLILHRAPRRGPASLRVPARAGGKIFFPAGPGLLALVRALEDARQVVGGDTFAGAGDRALNYFALGHRAQGHGAFGGGVAEGVGDQIVEDALELGRAHHHGVHAFGDLPDESHASTLGLWVEVREGVGDQVV